MAVRVECYAVPDGLHLEIEEDAELDAILAGAHSGAVNDDGVRFLGYVSANDNDEQMLFDLLGVLAERSGLFDARTQGAGVMRAREVAAVMSVGDLSDRDLAALGGDDDCPARSWLTTLLLSMAMATTLELGVAWRTRYDRGGSVDDGVDEFPTAWEGPNAA
jgi:hypothetical protein